MPIKVSIIIPVYNAEKYLAECLDSVINQTYTNLEILLINDGSTDASGVICDKYSGKDSRVHTIHNKNHGVSYSRNVGIQTASGEYTLFIDSDDAINERYVEELVKVAGKYDLCVATIVDRWPEKSKEQEREFSKRITNYLRDDYYWAWFAIGMGAWGKLFSTRILKQNNIFFPEEVSWGEDRIFLAEYFKRVTTYIKQPEAKYIYFHRTNESLSQMGNMRDDIKLMKKSIESLKSLVNTTEMKKKDIILGDYCWYYLPYTKTGYFKFKIRCAALRSILGSDYNSTSLKRQLVLQCLKWKIYFPIYFYYRTKGL